MYLPINDIVNLNNIYVWGIFFSYPYGFNKNYVMFVYVSQQHAFYFTCNRWFTQSILLMNAQLLIDKVNILKSVYIPK